MKYSKVSKILSLIMVLLLVSCASTSSAIKQSDLIGKWTQEEPTTIEDLPKESIEFFEDGKVVIANIYNGTYKLLENGELQVTVNGAVYQGPIKISDCGSLNTSKSASRDFFDSFKFTICTSLRPRMSRR